MPNPSVPLADPPASLPAGTLLLVLGVSLPLASGALSFAVGVMTNEQLTAAVLDLNKMVAGIRMFLLGLQPPPPTPPPQQQLPLLPPPASLYPYGMPYDMMATAT